MYGYGYQYGTIKGEGGGGINPFIAEGLTYLISSAKAAWDFTGISGNPYDNSPQTLSELTSNGFGLNTNSGYTTPKLGVSVNGTRRKSFISVYTPSGTRNAYYTDLGCTNLYNSSFEVHILMKLGDGNPSSNHSIWGLNDGAAKRMFIDVLTSGQIQLYINLNGAVTTTYTTNSAVFSNGSTNLTYLRFKADFENDVLGIYVNGIEQASTIGGSAVSLINPSGFSATTGNGIGTRMNSATVFAANPISYCGVFKAAITPILSDENNLKVGAWMSNL